MKKEVLIPLKLQKGDEIRVIAPSRSMAIIGDSVIKLAQKRLETEGVTVSYGKNVKECINDDFKCGSIKSRLQDIHEAFQDKNVKAILTAIGGYNSNQLLNEIDYEMIQANPKIFCGFSDITALSNAIFAKTGMVTYSGMHFSSFGMQKGIEYSVQYFKKILMESKPIQVQSSDQWSNDSWFQDQANRTFCPNEGMKIVYEGEAEGTIIGGNLCTLNLLQGTNYMPELENSILLIEDDGLVGEHFEKEFDRNLQSLLHCAKEKKIKGVIFGRAEKASQMTDEKWKMIIQTKKELTGIPIVIQADFGHTTPIFTFPIGGYCRLKAQKGKVEIEIEG